MSVEPKTEEGENHKIEMRMSPFSLNNPNAWFRATEIQFDCFGIKSDIRKTGLLMQAVMCQPEAFGKITDILEGIPEKEKYQYLKENIIKRLSSSRKERLEMLLEKVELGDRSPSEVLRHMRTLSTEELQVTEDKKIDELSAIFDKIYEVHKVQNLTINEVRPANDQF